MTWICSYDEHAIELALERLREDGIIWQPATSKGDAPLDRRREAADRGPNCPSRPSGIREEIKPVRAPSRCRSGGEAHSDCV